MSSVSRDLLWVAELDSPMAAYYGACLLGEPVAFHDCWDDGSSPSGERVDFAWRAVRAACWPAMSWSYLRTDPRLVALGWYWDGPDHAAVDVVLAVPPPAALTEELAAARGWQGWRDVREGADATWVDPFENPFENVLRGSEHAEPGEGSRLIALTSLTLRIPLFVDVLPTPLYWGREFVPDVGMAKLAVAAVCRQVNRATAGVLAGLDQPEATLHGRDRGLS